MRASASWPAVALVIGLGVASCSGGEPVASEAPTSPAPADSPSAEEEEAAGPEQTVVWVESGQQTAAPGVVMTSDGYVLTAAGLVGDADGGPLQIVLPGGDTTEAELVGSDPVSNLAVVRAVGAADLTPAVFAGSGAVAVDDEVQLFGGPPGSGPSVVGVVRATDRVFDGSTVIEVGFDTALATGGPLVDGAGEVVGIITMISAAFDGDGEVDIGYAVSAAMASRVATDLIETGQVVRPHLGVQLDDADGAGALVHAVIAASPADQAGLQAGDVINRLGDDPVDGPEALLAVVRSSRVGDELRLIFTREGNEQEVTVVLVEAPEEDMSQ